jgi:hypothetical protein
MKIAYTISVSFLLLCYILFDTVCHIDMITGKISQNYLRDSMYVKGIH